MTLSVFRSLRLRAALALGIIATAALPHATQAGENVTFRYLSSRGSFSPHELAAELGYFEGTGVTLKNLGYSAGGPESLFGLASGSVDVGDAATAAVINSIAGGNRFVAIYPGNGLDDQVKSNFYVLEGSPIRSVKDIVGKTIAVNTLGAHLDYTVREALHKAGLPQNAAKLVVVPGPQLEQTLRSRQVDAVAVGNWQMAFNGELIKNGGVRVVFTDTDVLGSIAVGFVVLRRDLATAHPEAVRIFIEQAARAVDWALANPDKAREVLARVLQRRGENKELAQYWSGFGLRPGAKATERDVAFWIDVLEREGRLPKGKLKVEDILYRSTGGTVGNAVQP